MTLQELFTSDTDAEKLAEEHPWCSVVQLWLLHQYKKNISPAFEKQGEKTALFFNNNDWLNWQLSILSEDNNTITETPLPQPQTPGELTGEEVIAFEPLHTVDYFASLGIKLTDEPVTNDKLGQQLKSFTEWLKTMKKIHAESDNRDDNTDQKIQSIAESSNVDSEVLTEAMAEVLTKQNKIDKAIELYRKLSLINPSKSAYFAGKIDSLTAGRND